MVFYISFYSIQYSDHWMHIITWWLNSVVKSYETMYLQPFFCSFSLYKPKKYFYFPLLFFCILSRWVIYKHVKRQWYNKTFLYSCTQNVNNLIRLQETASVIQDFSFFFHTHNIQQHTKKYWVTFCQAIWWSERKSVTDS